MKVSHSRLTHPKVGYIVKLQFKEELAENSLTGYCSCVKSWVEGDGLGGRVAPELEALRHQPHCREACPPRKGEQESTSIHTDSTDVTDLSKQK
jgi:hypothetical protein